MSDVTIVFTTTGFFGIEPFFDLTESIKFSIIAPVSLPLNNLKPPSFFLTAMPTRSASGSVASTISAFVFSASSIASLSAAFSSGLGYGHVGKFPSGYACSGTTVRSFTPILFSISVTGLYPVPLSGV